MKKQIETEVEAFLEKAKQLSGDSNFDTRFVLQDFISLMFAMVQKVGEIQSAEKVLFFLGNTGVGKSATINYLNGCQFTLKQVGLDFVYQIQETDSCRMIADVGHEWLKSKTLYPSIYNAGSGNNVQYCDLPGFYDTRSRTHQLVVAVGIDLVIKEVTSIQGFAVLISYDMITADKGSPFKKFLNNFVHTIGDINAIKDSLIFILTKVDFNTLRLKHHEVQQKFSKILQEFLTFEEENFESRSYCSLVVKDAFSMEAGIKNLPGKTRFVYVLTMQGFYYVDTVMNKEPEVIISEFDEKLRNLRAHFHENKIWDNLSADDVGFILRNSGHSKCSDEMSVEKSIFYRTKELLGHMIKNDRLFYVNLDTTETRDRIIPGINGLKTYDHRINFDSFLQGLLASILNIIVQNTIKQGINIFKTRYELVNKFNKMIHSIEYLTKNARDNIICLDLLKNILESDNISENERMQFCQLSTDHYNSLKELIGKITIEKEKITKLIEEIKNLTAELEKLETNTTIVDYFVPKICEGIGLTAGEGLMGATLGFAVMVGGMALAPAAAGVAGVIAALGVGVGVEITAFEGMVKGSNWFSTSGWFPTESGSYSYREQLDEEKLKDYRITCGFSYDKGFPYVSAAYSIKADREQETIPLNIVTTKNLPKEGLYQAYYICHKGMECRSRVWLTMEYRYTPEVQKKIMLLKGQIKSAIESRSKSEAILTQLQKKKAIIINTKEGSVKKNLRESLKKIRELDTEILELQKITFENNFTFIENIDLFEVVSVTQHLLSHKEVMQASMNQFIEHYRKAKEITEDQISAILRPQISPLEEIFSRTDFHWIDFLLDNLLQELVSFRTAKNENIIHLMAKNNYHLSLDRYENIKKFFDFNEQDNEGETPIVSAIAHGNEILAYLIIDKIEISQVKELILISMRKIFPVKFLEKILNKKFELCAGSNKDTVCDEKTIYPLYDSNESAQGNLLHLLVVRNLVDHFRTLLQLQEYQQYLNELDSSNRTPLSLAAFLNHVEIVKLVLNHKSYVFDKPISTNGKTLAPPIFWAILGKHEYVACLILRKSKEYHKETYYENTMRVILPNGDRVESISPSQYAEKIDPRVQKALERCDGQIFENPHPENLVFQGGGAREVAVIGSLKRLTDYQFSMQHVIRVAGTSAGAIMAMFLATGHTIPEIEEILKKTNFINFILDDVTQQVRKQISLETIGVFIKKVEEIYENPTKILTSSLQFLLKQEGICEGIALLEFLESHLSKKTAINNLTFGELAEKVKSDPMTYKHLYVVTTQLNPPKIVVFSSEDPQYNDYVISHVVRMSAGLPGIFSPHYPYKKYSDGRLFQLKESAYVDGGLVKNYPIDLFDRIHYQKGYRGTDKTAFHNDRTLGFRLMPVTGEEDDSIPKSVDSFIAENFALCVLTYKILSIFYNAEEMQLEYRGLHDDPRNIQIDDLGLSAYNFRLSEETVRQLLLNGAAAIDKRFQKPRLSGESVERNGFFVEAAPSVYNIDWLAQRSVHLFIQPTDIIAPRGRGFYIETSASHDRYGSEATTSAYPLVTYRQPSHTEHEYYDFGQWDNTIQQHPVTKAPLFTYRVFKMDEEVGSIQFYKHPLLCRSEDGTRHNVMEVKGILERADINEAIKNIDDICADLPPTESEQIKNAMISSAKHGAIRGIANVIAQTMKHRGISHSMAEKARDIFYYAGMFTVNTATYYSQNEEQDDELMRLSNAAYYSARDTACLFFTHKCLEIVCRTSHWIGTQADRAGWNQSAEFFKKTAKYGGYSIYAYNSMTRGPLEAAASLASGVVAQTVIEQTGSAVLHR